MKRTLTGAAIAAVLLSGANGCTVEIKDNGDLPDAKFRIEIDKDEMKALGEKMGDAVGEAVENGIADIKTAQKDKEKALISRIVITIKDDQPIEIQSQRCGIVSENDKSGIDISNIPAGEFEIDILVEGNNVMSQYNIESIIVKGSAADSTNISLTPAIDKISIVSDKAVNNITAEITKADNTTDNIGFDESITKLTYDASSQTITAE